MGVGVAVAAAAVVARKLILRAQRKKAEAKADAADEPQQEPQLDPQPAEGAGADSAG